MSAPMAGPPPTMPPPMPPPMYGMPPPMAPERTALPTAGGALLLVGGILGIINSALIFAVSSLVYIPGFEGLLAVCGAIALIFSLFAMIGGVMAIQRKMWGLALTGAILGLFAIGPLFLTSIFSLIGLILVAVSRREFT